MKSLRSFFWLWFAWVLTVLPTAIRAEQVVVSRIVTESREGSPQYIELYNNTSNPFDMGRWRLTGGAMFEFPDFSIDDPTASFLRPFERIVISSASAAEARAAYPIPASVRVFGPWSGKLKKKGDRVTLQDKNGVVLCTVKFKNGGLWPRANEGEDHSLVLKDANAEVDDWRNWRPGRSAGDVPGAAPIPTTISPAASPELDANVGQVLVDYGSMWRYEDSGQALGASWRQPDFDDSAWREGPGLLGYDQKPLPKPGLRTQINMGRQITYYFRCQFNYHGTAEELARAERLVLDQILDDGAVCYLNGREILRSRMLSGPVRNETLASTTVPTASEELAVTALEPKLVRQGVNVLAVEVHQASPNSSDVVFGMRLRLLETNRSSVVINELYGGNDGFVEFYNTATMPVNLKDCFLSDTTEDLRKHKFSVDMVLPTAGLGAVSLAECRIENSRPLTLYLTAADGQTILSAVTASFAEDGRSLGRGPDGSSAWFRFPEPSRGQTNRTPDLSALTGAIHNVINQDAGSGDPAYNRPKGRVPPRGGTFDVVYNDGTNGRPRQSDVVINEIMFDPPYQANGTEYIELLNRGTNHVDLSGYRFSEGVTFDFPSGTVLGPGGYLAVAANAAKLKSVYGDIPVIGDFRGRLRHRGELLRLADAGGHLVNELDFKCGGDWPGLTRGGGSSLELVNPWMDNTRSSAWRDSLEGAKSRWQTCGCTNTYRELNRMGQPSDYRELHLYLVGAGHVAVRNVGLWKRGVNYLDNPERMSTDGTSADGWLAMGTHWSSFMTNGELHVVSDGRGDNRADHVEIDCVRIRAGETYELRFDARWISGCPRLVAATWDHSVGQSFLLNLPAKLGTPGLANSVSLEPLSNAAQASPQVDDLLHSPPVPHSTDSVKVTARVFSAAPLGLVRLFHRPDNTDADAPWSSKPMFDNGTHGDLLAGDGIYTAELSEYGTNGQIVQFYVEALGANRQMALLPRRGPEQPAMFVVDDQKLNRDGRLDRFIISTYDLGSMRDGESAKYGFHHPRLSNHRYNMTFISNEEKVFYGGEIRISGSPFTRSRSLTKGKWELPGDRPFRGRTKFYFDNDSNIHNQLCRYLLYQLGHVTCQSEWIRVVINNAGAYLREDTEPVTSEFIERVFPDGRRGELYRFDDEWWFTDSWQRQNRDADWSYKGTDDPLQYRTEWQKHSHEVEDDYSALIAFFKAYAEKLYSDKEMERFLDSEAVLQLAAVRGYISDWDNFTMFRGKNGFFYRHASDGRFQFLQWDSDLAFRPGNYPFYGPRIAAWIERPDNRERFDGYLRRLAEFSQSPRLETWFDLQAVAVPPRTVNADFYRSFFQQRNLMVSSPARRNQSFPLMFRQAR